MDEMRGKAALITGASSGIGRAAAVKFAAEGARVALVARSPDKLAELAAAIKANGGQAQAIAADLSEVTEIERVVSETTAHFGGIDVLVNAAGILVLGTIESTSLAEWDTIMNLNVRGLFYLTQQSLPYLIERRGNVVNVSSITGLRAFPGILAYCISKAAIDQLTRCLALEVARYGVRINAVNPGVVVTSLHHTAGMSQDAYQDFLEHSKQTHPIGRVGRPEEVAELISYLASSKAGWITGATYSIDGGRGQTCAR